ncbi:putative tetratricopeptide-like helical domain superfamily [Dioscorea sansibarensis]
MVSSLLHALFPPSSLRRKSTAFKSISHSHKLHVRLPSLASWFSRKDLWHLRCATQDGFSLPDWGPENSKRVKLQDDSNNCTDGMGDIKRQLEELFDNVKTMIKMGNKDDALDLLQANCEVVKEQLNAGFKGIEQAAVLDVLALGYMGVGEFKFAERLLQLLNELVSSLHDGLPLVDTILIHMGSMYTSLRMFDNALLVYERGLKIIEKECGNKSPFLITPLLGMAKTSNLIGRPSKAITIYRRSIDILELVRGTDSEELVIPLFSLGNIFISEGKAADAESCYSRILNIYEVTYGENDGRVGVAMCSLAHAKCAKGNLDEAICLYKKGLQVIKDASYMNLDDDILENLRIDLAELLHLSGREREGRQLLEECLLISESYKGSNHPDSVTHLLNLATSYSRSKNFVEAERLLRMSLHIISQKVGPEDNSITIPMLHLAVVLYHLKQDEEAETLALEAVRIRETTFGKESLPVGEALDCLVSIQTRLGKDDSDMLRKLKRVLSIQEKELGFQSEETITTLKKVVFYLNKMGEKDELCPLQRRLRLLKTKINQKAPV